MAGKRIAAMHGRAVVPHDDVPGGPVVFVDQFGPRHVRQQSAEQRLTACSNTPSTSAVWLGLQ